MVNNLYISNFDKIALFLNINIFSIMLTQFKKNTGFSFFSLKSKRKSFQQGQKIILKCYPLL